MLNNRYIELYVSTSSIINDFEIESGTSTKTGSIIKVGCEFSIDSKFGSSNDSSVVIYSALTKKERLLASTVKHLSSSHGKYDYVDKLQCEIPVMDLGERQVNVRIRINETMDPSVQAHLSIALS